MDNIATPTLTLDQVISVAEQALERRGFAGRTITVPVGHRDDPAYQQAIAPLVASVRELTGWPHMQFFVDNHPLDRAGASATPPHSGTPPEEHPAAGPGASTDPNISHDGLRIYDKRPPLEQAQRRLERDRVPDAELRPVVSGPHTGRRTAYRFRQWGVYVDGVLTSTLYLRRDGRVQRSWPTGREYADTDPPTQP